MIRHCAALGAALGAVAVIGAATVELGRRAAAGSARVTAVFPPGTSAAAMLAGITMADGRLIRNTLVPFAVEVQGDAQGIAARLDAEGAVFVIARLPTAVLAVGGCSYRPAAACPALHERLRALSL